jgi:hypothetical protein
VGNFGTRRRLSVVCEVPMMFIGIRSLQRPLVLSRLSVLCAFLSVPLYVKRDEVPMMFIGIRSLQRPLALSRLSVLCAFLSVPLYVKRDEVPMMFIGILSLRLIRRRRRSLQRPPVLSRLSAVCEVRPLLRGFPVRRSTFFTQAEIPTCPTKRILREGGQRPRNQSPSRQFEMGFRIFLVPKFNLGTKPFVSLRACPPQSR